jgi:hypothetical protein
MTKSLKNVEDRRLQRKTAAFRLKHDVGKALRWSAPEERETNPDELRARLVADLLPRTRGGRAGRDALESFIEWKREEGPLFPSGDPDLEAVERAMTVVGRLTKIFTLSESSLLSLDDACLEASRACTAFYRRVALDDGAEMVRPLGARP